MSVLLFAENTGGQFKKATLEAAGYAKAIAGMVGGDVHAVAFGSLEGGQSDQLGKYGVSKLHHITQAGFDKFQDASYTKAVAEIAQKVGAKVVVIPQSYNGRPLAARLAIRLNASLASGVNSLPEWNGSSFTVKRLCNSGKGIETVQTHREVSIFTLKTNSFGLKENATSIAVEAATVADPGASKATPKELVKTSERLSITEAETVVSGGRGFKGPENWHVLLDLAEALVAGTACSKPVADMDWRPHHEHVGQTGIQIGPNLYIAMGISGAIQHLAGVNTSKNIVVINKDADAPFFKIADYGIVGDLFDVVPKMTEAVKRLKAHS
jgi:electron transfer flavoprotein alpha subunit